MPHPTCRHCHVRIASRHRGLCRSCYYDPEISPLYPSTSKFAHKRPVREPRKEGATNKRLFGAACSAARKAAPTRQPGDPAYRCLWCLAWRCEKPLQLCPECEREYQALAVGMPVESEA